MRPRSLSYILTSLIAIALFATGAAFADAPANEAITAPEVALTVSNDAPASSGACQALSTPALFNRQNTSALAGILDAPTAGAEQCECAIGLCPGLPCPRCNFPYQCEPNDCFQTPNEPWINGVCK